MKLWVALAVAAFAMPAHATVRYTATILQTPEGLNMQAFGLNNAGEIVGGVQGASYEAYYRSASGVYKGLGGFGGNRSTATSIADNGVIGGMGRTGTTSSTSLPFIGSPAGIRSIALPDGATHGSVADVNSNGALVGFLREPLPAGQPRDRGFRWTEAGGFEVLRSSDGLSLSVNGVNLSGTAVADSFDSALVWNTDGSVTKLEKRESSTAFSYSSAADINDNGLIAGSLIWDDESFATRQELAIWSQDGRLLRTASMAIGSPSASAFNNRGDVVGAAYRFQGFPDGTYIEENFAILWQAGSEVANLNTLVDLPEIKLVGSFGINDHGQIIAWGLRDALRVDVLLTPNAVPELASWAMMIAGFGLAGGMARRTVRRQRALA